DPAEVALFAIELTLAAGMLEAAWQQLAAARVPREGPAGLRWAIVTIRAAILTGRLSAARARAGALGTDGVQAPELIAHAAVARVAVLSELNLLEEAQRVADD